MTKIDWWFEIYIRNLINFLVSSRKSENLFFDGPILSGEYKVLCLMTMESDPMKS